MTHILYSFRRCPYAIRARLALAYSQQHVQLREVILKDKPDEMLKISSKATVPVLQLSNGEVIDESLDIMAWAISRHDPELWLSDNIEKTLTIIDANDFEFKKWLDKYKYADRYPMNSEAYYREQCEDFLVQLESLLKLNKYLFSENISLADIAIFPFIRQFAAVDSVWFQQSPYPYLIIWHKTLVNSDLFKSVMKKYPAWKIDKETQYFP